MGRMNSKQLYYFTVIAETGSFTAAAKKLGLSQPPLSKQIMMLEEDLGVRLLTRGARKAELTEAGAYLYSRARDILSMMDTAADELQNFPSSSKGILKLGTISSSGNVLTGAILPGFCRLHPNVRFDVYEGNTYELLEKLKNGIIECAVVRTPFNADGFHCVSGTEEPLAAVGSPSFFEAVPEGRIRLTDLAGKPLIYYRRFDAIISMAFQNIGASPNVFCRNDDARTCLQWACAGLGVALVPESISRMKLADELAVRIIDSEETVTHMTAIYKKNGYVSNIAKEFVDYFEASASRRPADSDAAEGRF